MELKKLSIVLCAILSICLFSGCTPTCVIDESEMMQDVNIIEFAATSRIIEYDEAKRAMFALERFEDNNWDEPLTVEDLNAMDKYVVSDAAK